MPIKDRLSELQQQSLNSQNDGSLRDPDAKSKSMEKVYKQVELISKLISDVAENTKACEEILQGKTVQRPKEQHARLASTFKESEAISLKISAQLKKMKADLKNQQGGADSRMYQVQYAGLVERFKNTLQAHQECVQRHRDVRRDLLEKSTKIVLNETLESDELLEGESGKAENVFAQNYLLEERQARQQLTDVENRHKELLTIESHLTEIRDLFVQMAILIEQQQESVNRIEFHAMTAAEYVDNTVDQLEQAETSQRKKRKTCFWIWIIIAIALVIIVIGMLI